MAIDPIAAKGIPAGRYRADPSKRFFVCLLVLAVLGLIGIFLARPTYRLFRERRGAGLADEIDQLMAQDPPPSTDIARRLKVALGLAPNEPRLLRQAATYLGGLGQESALNYYEMLIGRRLATREERVKYVGLALDFSQVEKAQLELKELLKSDPRDLDAMRLSIRLLRQKADFQRAILASRVALAAHPMNDELQLTLGSLLLQGTNEVQRTEGRRVLFSLALSSSPHHDRAVDTLTLSTNLTRMESELLARELLARTNVSVPDRLSAATLELRSNPERKAEIIRTTLEQLGPLTTTNLLTAVGSWLWRLREYETVLGTIPPEVAQTNSPLLAIRLECLAELHRWNELQRFLDLPSTNLQPVYLHCLRGLASARNGRAQDAPAHFEMAIKAATNGPARLMFVARFAELAGYPEVAIDAWRPLLAHPGTTLNAAREILRLARPLDDLRVSRDVLRRVAELAPSDHVIRGQLTYLNLILGERVEPSRAAARQLVEEHPDETGYRFTLALAELRANNPGAALSFLEQKPLDWDSLEERWRAIYVAALGANHQRESARQFARKVELSRLKPVERDLVKPWL